MAEQAPKPEDFIRDTVAFVKVASLIAAKVQETPEKQAAAAPATIQKAAEQLAVFAVEQGLLTPAQQPKALEVYTKHASLLGAVGAAYKELAATRAENVKLAAQLKEAKVAAAIEPGKPATPPPNGQAKTAARQPGNYSNLNPYDAALFGSVLPGPFRR